MSAIKQIRNNAMAVCAFVIICGFADVITCCKCGNASTPFPLWSWYKNQEYNKKLGGLVDRCLT